MKLKRRYTFLYMPEDHGASRQVHLPRWLILGVGAAFLLLGLGTVLYGVDIGHGGAWRPGGSRLARENMVLEGSLASLGNQVDAMQVALDGVRQVQVRVASAVNLPIPDDETYAAGVGGRGLLGRVSEVPGQPEIPGAGMAAVNGDLERMLRQAQIQQQGYLAMLDTLSARATVREQIPSIRPLDTGWLSSRFGFRKDPFTGKQTYHRGLDFSVPVGTPVRVTGDGKVVAVQTQRGFGKVVKVDHGNGVLTVYAHLDRALVEKGARVKRGEVIARSGNSGRSSAPHLHYEVRMGDRAVNPLSYILDSYAGLR
jgi:murein DD-endopeptidase MepM/ murein hydrolase activator NlpD